LNGSPVDATFIANTWSASKSTLTADGGDVVADGVATHTVTATITDDLNHPLQNVPVTFTVSGGPVLSAGGKFTDANGKAVITVTSTKAGSFGVSATVDDTALTNSPVQVSFIAGPVDPGKSKVTISTETATGNNSDTHTVTALLLDANDNPVQGKTVDFTTSGAASLSAGSNVTTPAGTTTTTVKASAPGTYPVTASYNGTPLSGSPVDAVFITGDIDYSSSTLTIDALGGIVADGAQAHTITAKVVDVNGAAVSGVTVGFTAPSGTLSAGAEATNSAGVAIVTITSKTAGTIPVSATVNGNPLTPASVNALFIAGSMDPANSPLTISAGPKTADGVDAYTVTATVKDTNGNPLPSTTVRFTGSTDATLSAATADTNPSGVATITVTSTQAGNQSVAAQVGGVPLQFSPVTAQFVAGPVDATMSKLTIDTTDAVVADGAASHTVTATIVDHFNNPVSGQKVDFTATGATLSAASQTTPGTGVVTVTVTSKVAGSHPVSATVGGAEISGSPVQAVFEPGPGDPTALTTTWVVTPSGSVVADGSAAYTGVVTVTDKDGNLVDGASVKIDVPTGVTAKNGAGATLPVAGEQATVSTGTDGTATVSFTSTIAPRTYQVGAYLVTPSGQIGAKATLTFIPKDPVTGNSSWTVTPTTPVTADGTSAFTATVTLRDDGGNPVSGSPGVAVTGPAGVTISPATDVGDGTYTVKITSTIANDYVLTATLNGAQIGAPVTVTFAPGPYDKDVSTFSVTQNTAYANGSDVQTATATVTDKFGNPIQGVTVIFAAAPGTGSGKTAHLSSTSQATNASGVASVSVTASSPDSYPISAAVGGIDPHGSPADAVFIGGTPTKGTVSVDSTTAVVADGTESHTVTATVTDAYDNPLSGVRVSFAAATPAQLDASSAYTDANGVATVKVTSAKAGSYAITPTVAGVTFTPASVDAVFKAGGVEYNLSMLTIDNANALANGTDTHTVTATVVDGGGNPIADKTVLFTAPSGVTLTAYSGVTDANGVATTKASSYSVGSFPVSATVDAKDLNGSPVNATFLASAPSAGDSTVAADGGDKIANGTDTHTVTATVLDAQKHPLEGVLVSFSVTGGPVLSTGGQYTDANGKAVITVTSTKAGQFGVTATMGAPSTALTDSPAQVSFVAGPVDPGKSTVTISTEVATGNNADTHTVTATVVDANGNPVSGATVDFATSGAATLSAGSKVTGSAGSASTLVKASAPGTYPVTAEISGSPLTGSPVDAVFVSGAIDYSASTLTIDSLGGLVADGAQAHTVTATILDVNGVAVPGVTVNFTSPSGTRSTGAQVTNSAGVAMVTITSKAAGSIPVSATVNGNPLTPASVDALFVAGPMEPADSPLTISAGPKTADGVDAYTVTATVKDVNGNPLQNTTVRFTGSADATLSNDLVSTDVNGVATIQVTSTQAGNQSVAASVGGVPLHFSPVTAQFVAGPVDQTMSKLTIDSPNAVTANGTASHTVTATVVDHFNNPVSGQTVNFTGGGADLSASSGTTPGTGVVTITVTSSVAGSYPVSASVGAGQISGSPVQAVFAAGAVDPNASQLTVTSGDVEDNGVATHSATVTVTDKDGNPVANTTVAFTLSSGASLSAPTAVSAADGTATVTITSTHAGTYTVSAYLGTTQVKGSPATVSFINGAADATTSDWTVTPAGPIYANGTDTYTATFTALDKTGNAVPNQVITLAFPGGLTASSPTVTTRGDGTITATFTSTTAATYPVTASIGANAISTKQLVFMSAAKPPAPVVNPTNGKTESGTGTPGDTVRITDSAGHTIAETTVKPDGTWTTPLVPPQADGSSVTAVDISPTNVESDPTTVTVDALAPDAPMVNPTNGSEVTGTAEPGSTVKVKDHTGKTLCTDTASSTGSFSCVPSPKPGDGEVLTVTATDASGNESTPTTVTVDSTAPDAPVVNPTNGSEVSGTAEPGSTVKVKDHTGKTLCSTTAGSTGSFSCTPSPKPGDGEVLTVTATDAAGNESTPTTVVVDSVPPDAPVVNPTNGSEVSGTAEPGSTVTVKDRNGKVLCSTTAGSGGSFSCIPSPKPGDGDDLTVTAKDAAGNESQPTTVTVDSVPPDAPVVNPTDGSEVSGTAEPGSTVKVKDRTGKVLCSVTAGTSGAFSCTPSPKPGDGDELTVTATDPAGNVSDPTKVTVDSTAPDAPVVNPTNGSEVTGTAEPGSTVKVKDRTGKVLCSVTAGTNGSFSCVPSPKPGDGDELTVTATDAAGNVSDPTTVTVDSVPPDAPVVNPTNGSEVSGTAEPGSTVAVKDRSGKTLCSTTAGSSGSFSCIPSPKPGDGDELTVTATDAAGNQSQPTVVTVDSVPPDAPVVNPTNGSEVTGTAEPGSTVKVKDRTGRTLCSVTAGTDGSFSCTPNPKPGDGDELTITATDPSGNVSDPTKVTVDSTAPDAPVVNPTNGSEVTGTAEPGSTVEVKDNHGNTLCSTTAGTTGTFSCVPNPKPGDGDELTITAKDAAGNVSDPTKVTVDSLAPDAPMVNPTNGSEVNGTAEPGSKVEVKDNHGNTLCSTTAGSDGSFACIPMPKPGDGDLLVITATDAAGNVSNPTTVMVDATPPNAPKVDPTDGSEVTGTAEPGSSVKVMDGNGNTLCTATAGQNGKFSCVPSTKPKPGDILIVTATDAAGNTSVPTALTVTSPAAPHSGTGGSSGTGSGALINTGLGANHHSSDGIVGILGGVLLTLIGGIGLLIMLTGRRRESE